MGSHSNGDMDFVRAGHGLATNRVLGTPWPSLSVSKLPMVEVGQDGEPRAAGELYTLANGESVWMPNGRAVKGLPVELVDARPDGFLGRQFAALHPDLPLPARLDDWSDHHVLLALSRRGDDLPGNLLVGDESFERWQSVAPIPHERNKYPELAKATLAGRPPGSLAGGERPKFGVMVEGRHYLVKFAGPGTPNDVVAHRWRDLLVLESVALEVVSTRHVPTAHTRLLLETGYAFLESERFDRIGERGRIAVLSLAAVHDNPADSWARAAGVLEGAGRLSTADAARLKWLDAFGALIANTDRHPHNVVFFSGGDRLALAPAFDQVPMLYAPSADGQVPPRSFVVPVPGVDTLEVWTDARLAAAEFWQRASADERLSDGMRLICAANGQQIRDR